MNEVAARPDPASTGIPTMSVGDDPHVAVVGLGDVSLPVAVAFVETFPSAISVDGNASKVAMDSPAEQNARLGLRTADVCAPHAAPDEARQESARGAAGGPDCATSRVRSAQASVSALNSSTCALIARSVGSRSVLEAP